MNIEGIFAIFCVFIGAPSIVFGFIYLKMRNKHSIEKMRLNKEILELELEKEKTHLKALEIENIKYDRIIKES